MKQNTFKLIEAAAEHLAEELLLRYPLLKGITLEHIRGCCVRKVSSFLVTKPYGGVEQDDFLNACLMLKTFFPPLELLDCMHEIE